MNANSVDTSRQNSAGRFSRYSVRTGTNAAFAAPSPTRSRKRFGILKLTTNASAEGPVPKKCAMRTSRTNPRTRDTKVMEPSVPADRTKSRRVDSLGSIV